MDPEEAFVSAINAVERVVRIAADALSSVTGGGAALYVVPVTDGASVLAGCKIYIAPISPK